MPTQKHFINSQFSLNNKVYISFYELVHNAKPKNIIATVNKRKPQPGVGQASGVISLKKINTDWHPSKNVNTYGIML